MSTHSDYITPIYDGDDLFWKPRCVCGWEDVTVYASKWVAAKEAHRHVMNEALGDDR